MNPYEIITDRIISLFESGVAPWQKPWSTNRGMPRNLISGKCYRGINIWLLHSAGYESPFWLTFKQASAKGASVRSGEKSTPCVFWSLVDIEDSQTGNKSQIPFLKYYNVFNVAQVDGLGEIEKAPQVVTPADQIVANYTQKPTINHGMSAAFYRPIEDVVGMPDQNKFTSTTEYYSTLFHELGHSTGHSTRLNRLAPTQFGSETYGKEELVAELTSAYLCATAGLERHIESNTAYLAGWIQALKSDTKLIVNSAACAQRASDYILQVQH